MDDKRARQVALGFEQEITGTLGLLIQAFRKGIISDIDSIVAYLQEIGFRLPPNTESLIKAIINDKKRS
ncbi:MAG: DUF3368 domain-containing protein [Treponema sp.]|nr:DUF3368 domain-containing protein [Treponema sp.]